MRNLENLIKYKTFLLISLIWLVVFFSFLGFLRPKIANVFQLQKKISQDKKKLTLLTQKLAMLEGLDEGEILTKSQLSLKALPPEKDIAAILFVLKTLSFQTEVTLRQIGLEPGELSSSKKELSFLTLSLKASGEEERIRTFLEKIELALPLMRIEKISITPKESFLVEADIGLNVFFFPVSEVLGSVETPLPIISPREEQVYQELAKFNSYLIEEIPSSTAVGRENPFSF